MKSLLIFLITFVSFVLCQAQDKNEQPAIHRKNSGTISSVKFSGSEKDIPESANAFFQKYLKAKPDDSFAKVPHQSKREGYVHEH
ncbi:hypothetical protein [Reichenbachiella ulvae]|uniref:Uncharacterized protein n=1 Tax=Reichenbachiella ulvae TaxID=2980104 RepID=A0ABT3CWQ4_9BACT|nr:hypothetical protein [Reichenbachiella ulvae]MCV9388136.1 hypothetical protein [Reichenbachiella ulvae]